MYHTVAIKLVDVLDACGLTVAVIVITAKAEGTYTSIAGLALVVDEGTVASELCVPCGTIEFSYAVRVAPIK